MTRLILTMLAITTLSGCVQYGQTVMVSKGQAGAMAQIFGSQAEFCKITSTPDITLTDADREAFRKYCAGNE